MSNAEKILKEHGLEIPECPVPIASYVPARVEGNFVYLSGQTAWVNGELQYAGKVGEDVTLEQGYESAKLAALRCISELRSVADLDKVSIVKVVGYVNCTPDYEDQPKVVNGASDLFVLAFGEKGKHARAAIGMGSLPDGASVEIEAVAYIHD